MNFILQPWQLVCMILAAWVNREQQELIEYLRCENQVLKEKLGKQRILLNDDQRRRLAVKGKVLGRKRLAEIGTLFSPDTILRWHRLLVAKKWDYAQQRNAKVGRPSSVIPASTTQSAYTTATTRDILQCSPVYLVKRQIVNHGILLVIWLLPKSFPDGMETRYNTPCVCCLNRRNISCH